MGGVRGILQGQAIDDNPPQGRDAVDRIGAGEPIKNFGIMKFECIFAMFTPRTKTYSICENGLFSYPFGSADSANIGYRLSLDAHSLNACRFLAEREAIAFLI